MSALKILTIDGGGLQALTTLSILNDICEAIGKNSNRKRVPAPYELFDIIGGIGTGGWLALLLGRFRLDIVTCMSVYMEIAKAIDPQGRLQSTNKRFTTRYRLDQKKLMAKIDQVLDRYGLDKHLLDRNIDAEMSGAVTNVAPLETIVGEVTEDVPVVRCKYVFAAGVIDDNASKDARNYQIFRTYESTPKSNDVQNYYREGPSPATCKISEACAATGAAQYFLKPCKIGKTTFFDASFPHPHKVSSLALDEAYSIFGKRVELSIILNVGPSIAHENDVKELKLSSSGGIGWLVKKFSWPKIARQTDAGTPLTSEALATVGGRATASSTTDSSSRTETSSSLTASDTEIKLQHGIRERLMRKYKHGGDQLYHHIGPVERFAQQSLCLNDVAAMDLSNEEVDKFRGNKESKEQIEDAARQYVAQAATMA